MSNAGMTVEDGTFNSGGNVYSIEDVLGEQERLRQLKTQNPRLRIRVLVTPAALEYDLKVYGSLIREGVAEGRFLPNPTIRGSFYNSANSYSCISVDNGKRIFERFAGRAGFIIARRLTNSSYHNARMARDWSSEQSCPIPPEKVDAVFQMIREEKPARDIASIL